MLPGHADPSGGGSRLYNNLIPQPIVSCLIGGPSVMFPSDAGLWMPTLLGRASGPERVKPLRASMPGKDSSFLFPEAKLRIPDDIRSLIPVISVHSVDGLMARS